MEYLLLKKKNIICVQHTSGLYISCKETGKFGMMEMCLIWKKITKENTGENLSYNTYPS